MAVVPRPPVPHLTPSTLPHCPPPPQPVVRAAHLLSPQLGHEDSKNADKYEEINLLGETEAEPARSRAGNQRVEPRFPGWEIAEDGLEEAGPAVPIWSGG